MQEITITNTPAKLAVNFEELRESLELELRKYDVLVTAETVVDAKKLAADLNKTKKLIDDRRKEEVAKASEPVRIFEASMKELSAMIDAGRAKLLEQVKRFEDERRELAAKLLERARDELWIELDVRPEFFKAKFEDLAIISNLTDKGNLSSKARAELRARVQADRALQDQTDRRLLELENQSYKAGLAAPLTRDHVAHFLFANDDVYQLDLERILEAEIRRQQEAERRERERIEAEQKRKEREELERKAAAERAEAERIRREQEAAQREQEAAQHAQEAAQHEHEPAQANGHHQPEAAPEPGTEWVRVDCVFTIEVPATASNQAIENKLREMMAAAGFQSRPEIRVTRLA